MASFKVPCPSCENEVLITNPNVIGSKTECPKCKYRFKVEEPAGGMPKEEAKGEKTDKVGKGKGKEKDKKDKNKDKLPASTTPGGKKKSKKLVAFVVGGLAIVVLAVVGFAMMGGDKKPPANKGGPVAKGSAPVSPNTNGTTGTDEGADPKEKDKVDPKNDKKDPVEKVEPIDPRRKQYPPSDKDELRHDQSPAAADCRTFPIQLPKNPPDAVRADLRSGHGGDVSELIRLPAPRHRHLLSRVRRRYSHSVRPDPSPRPPGHG